LGLLRGCEIPSTSDSEIEQLGTDLHEWNHIDFDLSPAKILARLLLVRAYIFLNALLSGESWDEKSWRGLTAMNASLSEICRAITLSEELVATAVSFWAMTKKINSIEVARLEKKSIKNYQKKSPHFAGLYSNVFKKVAGWLGETDNLSTLLALYLQGIRRYKHQLVAVNSNRRCWSLAENIKDIKMGWS
jgi:hypothetical protein